VKKGTIGSRERIIQKPESAKACALRLRFSSRSLFDRIRFKEVDRGDKTTQGETPRKDDHFAFSAARNITIPEKKAKPICRGGTHSEGTQQIIREEKFSLGFVE